MASSEPILSALRKLEDNLTGRLTARIDELRVEMNGRFDAIEARLERLETEYHMIVGNGLFRTHSERTVDGPAPLHWRSRAQLNGDSVGGAVGAPRVEAETCASLRLGTFPVQEPRVEHDPTGEPRRGQQGRPGETGQRRR
jgi:hypothetical protein